MTLDEAINMARDYVSTKKLDTDNDSSDSSDEEAMAVSAGFQGTCHHCHKKGHKKFFCPARRRE